MRKRRFKILLFILLTPVVLLCVFLLFERIRGQISLARYKRELIAKGEKLTFAELIPPLPEGENGAPEVQAAIKRLHKGAVLPDNPPPVMKVTPAGHAVVGFREDVWVYDKVTNNWDQLAAELKTNDIILAKIRAGLASHILINQIDYFGGPKMLLPHLPAAKSLSFWFGASAQYGLREGKRQEASDNLVAQVQLPRLLAEDRIVISELVRIAVAAIARTTTWEAMQADGWTDGQLVQLQAAWQSNEFVTGMARTLIGERAFGEAAFGPLRGSNEAAVETLFWQEEIPFFVYGESSERPWWRKIVSKEMYCRIWRFAWSHQDEQHYLKGMQRLIEISRATARVEPHTNTSLALERFDSDFWPETLYGKLRFQMSSHALASIAKALQRAMRAETERSVCVCAIALKRYSLRYGKFPDTLDALVPEFLSSVPIDYMDGKPLRYRLNADGSFTLYSVGEDGKDDGGDTALLPDRTSTRNLWDRKDFVWPSPATPEEVEAYRKEAASE